MWNDRVGLGWRPELAAGIFDALDQIDVLEVIADNYVDASRHQRRALKMIARQVPVHIHSIALGMAGTEEVSTGRLERAPGRRGETRGAVAGGSQGRRRIALAGPSHRGAKLRA